MPPELNGSETINLLIHSNCSNAMKATVQTPTFNCQLYTVIVMKTNNCSEQGDQERMTPSNWRGQGIGYCIQAAKRTKPL